VETISVERHLVLVTPMLAGICLASGEWLSGLLWRPQVIATIEHALPVQQAYLVRVGGPEVRAAYALRRVPSLNIVFLRFVGNGPDVSVVQTGPPTPGEIVLIVEAGAGFAPNGRLSVVRDEGLHLDVPRGYLSAGGPVLNSDGALVGLCALDPDGTARIVPSSAIARAFIGTGQELQRRGWIGATLQPVTLVAQMRTLAQQSTGRLVLDVQPGGPAERAGLRAGDILLAIDGRRLSGPDSVRSVVGPHRIGDPVTVSFLRNGRVLGTNLTVAEKPT
jgi:membrane-associated protease RseP (regulator of RpoE activity)